VLEASKDVRRNAVSEKRMTENGRTKYEVSNGEVTEKREKTAGDEDGQK